MSVHSFPARSVLLLYQLANCSSKLLIRLRAYLRLIRLAVVRRFLDRKPSLYPHLFVSLALPFAPSLSILLLLIAMCFSFSIFNPLHTAQSSTSSSSFLDKLVIYRVSGNHVRGKWISYFLKFLWYFPPETTVN